MSLDLVVWLSCSVALAQDLPHQAEWRYDKLTAEQLSILPAQVAALLKGHESWQVERDKYLLRASYASSDLLLDGHATPAAEGGRAIGSGVTGGEQLSKRQAELGAKARGAKVGVSLVLEGSYDAGYPEQSSIATYLARKCRGAIVESPGGYYQVDERGDWSQ